MAAKKLFQRSLMTFVVMNHTAYVILIHFLAVFAQGQGPGTIRMTVVEELPPGTVVGQVTVVPNYLYSFQDQTSLFQMSSAGEVRTAVAIDREALGSPEIRLLAVGKPINSQDKQFTFFVVITVMDINDNSPVFNPQSGNQNISFQEDIREGRKSIMTATDPDAGENGTIASYDIVGGNGAGLFRLDFSGLPSILYVAKNGTESFDREKLDHYQLNISARDGGKPPRYGYTLINVEILDVNDNTPAFDLSQYKTQVNESAPVGSSVFRAEATDADIGLNGQIVYRLEDETKQFTIDENTGVIRTVSSPLICKMRCTRSTDPCNANSCFVVIEATDMGLNPLTGRAYLYIEVLDENDHDPVIKFFKEGVDSEISIAYVDENANISNVVFTISVSDADTGRNSETTLSIIHGNEGGYFSYIRLPNYGITFVTVAKQLDRETIDKFNITFKAVDNGTIPRSSTASIIIIVNDANDHSPEFEYADYKVSISEYAKPFSFVASIRATDKDEGINAKLTYGIASGNEALGWFFIDPSTGLVTTVTTIDHEEAVQVTLNISCHDGGSDPKYNHTTLVIDILDENDYTPKFSQTGYKAEIKENSNPNVELITVRAIDLDSGVNGTVEYSIHRDTLSRYPNYFSVQSTGRVMALKTFDREQKDQYIIKILASDKGPVPLSSTATIELTIKDVNDNRPKFSPKDYYINVFDTDPAGSPVTRVFAFDIDAGDYAKVTYLMADASNSFKINSDSGVISTSRVLIKQPYRLTVTAKDGGGLTSDKDATVNVIVINTSSASFPFFNSSSYSFTITEDNGEQAPQIGRTIGAVGAFSQYGRTVVYALTGGDPLGVFTIDSDSGRISTQLALDREERAEYNLTVIACDGEKITSRIVNIVVTDLNDNAPVFITDTTEATVMENWPVGQNVFFAQAVDKDSGNNKELSYTLTSTEDTNQVFSINSSTGIIYLAKPTYHMPKTSVTLTVTATDAGAVHKSSSMTVIVTVVDVNDHTPLFPGSGVELFLPESHPVNDVVKVLSATDDDKGRNAELSYRIVRGNEDKKFGIFPDGALYVAHDLDREMKAMYSLMVVVKDNGESPRSSAVNVTVFVEDVNDNRPQFSKDTFEFSIQENLPANTYIGTVKADDLDIGRNAEILYSLVDVNVNFTIDPVLGNIYSKISFDREYIMKKTNVSYSMFEIYATDNGQPKLQNKASVKVHITDVNDNPPVFVQSPDSTIGVSENSNVNDVVFTFLAVDDDEGANSVVSYTIVNGNEAGKFGINAATGQLFLKASIDREQVDHYALTVKATDTAAAEQLEAAITLNILVLDYNDNAPEFASDTLSSISVIETTSIGEVLVTFSGTDKDMGLSATLRYDIVSGNYDDALSLGMYSGKLTLVRSLDYESNNHGDHSLNITLSDLGFPSLSVARMFVVNVLDANDNAPIFTDGFTQFYFNETIPVGTRIAAVNAVDRDSGDYGRVQYSLYKQSPSGYYFGINAVTGEITLSRLLDRETYQSFRLTIQAIDQDRAVANRKTAEKSLTIIVQDANDNAPVFQTVGTFLVPYSSSIGNTIASVTATDQDTGDNGKVTYSFTGPRSALFVLNSNSGTIQLTSALPSSPLIYSLSIVAMDGGTSDALGPKSSTTAITLLVYTSNNGGPTFSSSSPATILENSQVGSSVMRVEATSSQGLAVSYYISRIAASGTDQGELFIIHRSSGVITTASVINREALRSDTLTVDIIAAEAADSEQRVTTKQVTIHVDDVNDCPPEFSSTLFDASVSENLALGSSVLQVAVSDPDITGALALSLSGADASKFRIVQNGTIYLSQSLDYETARVHDLNVTAFDGVQRSTAFVRIYVIDENDNTPVFLKSFYSFDVLENSTVDSTVGRVSATDADSGSNGLVVYEVISQWGLDYFRLDSAKGIFTLIKSVDFEDRQLYTLKVVARDQGSQPRSSEITVYMNVKDVNDNQPTFDPMSYYREISEDASVLTPVVNVSATDVDSGLGGEVRYSLVGSSASKFAIGPINGSIYTVAGLDREQVPVYNLIVMATDQVTNPKDRLSTTATVQVKLKDVNDNSPVFTTPATIEVREDARLDTSIFTVLAQDLDEGANSQLTFRLVSQTVPGTFAVDAKTGALSLKSALDRETLSNHSLVIEARDGGSPPRSTQQALLVQVADANDNAPVFTQALYSRTVGEDVAVGTSLLRVLATDRDIGFNGAVRYFILGGEGSNDFNLDMSSGVLRVQKGLDYERVTSYRILIQAEDSAAAEARLQANATIVVSLTDVNDFVPVFDDSPYVTFVQEGMPAGGGPVPILTISARDEDSGMNGMVTYSMRDVGEVSYSDIFEVDGVSGQVVVKKTLDREATPMYILTMVATDSGFPNQVGTATVTVFVKDVNDHTPVFDSKGPYLANIMENMAPETPVIIVLATDADEGMNSQIIYTLADNMGSKFTIHPSTAQISTAVSLDREIESAYNLTVIATDQGIPPRSASVQVTVMVGDDNDNIPEFDSVSYSASMYDTSVTGDFVIGVTAVDQDIGKNGKVVYTLEGASQSFFHINGQTGVVTLASPLPSASKTFNFIVRASDLGKVPLNSSASVTVSVLKAPTTSRPKFNDSNKNLRIKENAELGKLLTTVQATTATNNRITYYIVGGNVNNAFSINSNNGSITVAGRIDYELITSFNLWVEARDQGTTQLSDYQTLDIAIEDENDNPPVFGSSLYTASVLENCAVGTPVFTVTATDLDSGVNQQIVYAIKNGNENNTFQLDSSTGILSTLNKVVDREKIPLYNLEIEAADMGIPKRTASTTIRITILDLNDNQPTFVGPRSVAVPEDLPIGSLVLQLSSIDADIGQNALATYSIESADVPFVVNATSGAITNTQQLDAETLDRYSILVSVTDGSFIQRTTVAIRILDVNDNAPQLRSTMLVYQFTELQPPNTKVTQLSAQDLDKSSPNNLFFYSLRRPSSQFELNSVTGEIFALETMRFYAGQSVVDTMNDHILDVLVSDSGIPSLSSEATVNIKIIDANDHSPVFEKDLYLTAVPFNLMTAQRVVQLTCKDTMDYGLNAEVRYSVLSGSGLPYFTINETSGVIVSKAPLTGSLNQKLVLTVKCYDLGEPSLSTTVDVQLQVTDSNANAPRFNNNPFQKQVRENVTIGSVIDTITATDNDTGLNGEIEYFITGGNEDGKFAIARDTGRLMVNQSLDYETRTSYTIAITARDKALYSKEVTKPYDIQLIDVNDNKPVFDREYYDAYLQENSKVSTAVYTVMANDADGTAVNRVINYGIVGDAISKNSFQINPSTGEIVTGNAAFDYETRTLYTLLIMAFNPDQGNGESSYLKSVTTVYVHITGVNEDNPHFLVRYYNFSVSESAEIGTSVGRVTAVDNDHGVDGIVYYYLDAQSNLKGFQVEPLTGLVRVSKRPDFESSPTVLLSVIAKNWGSVQGNDIDTCTVNVTVVDANDPPEFSKFIYYANITENSPANTFVVNVYAEDKDIKPENRQFKYQIISGNVPERFLISTSGKIETSGIGVLDRETISKYTLVVGAVDLYDPKIMGTATVIIELLDVNDNAPRFNPEILRANVSDNETAGIDVIILGDYTVDADLPPNQGPYKFRVKDGPWLDYFSFNDLSGKVVTTKVLNRDLTPQFVIPVVVTDGGTPMMTSTLTFTIVVTDAKDAQPKPRPMTIMVSILENQKLSGKIADIRPLGSDLSDQFTCKILSGDAANFVINRDCDLEAVQLRLADPYKLKVRASNDKYPSVEYDVTIKVQTLTNNSLISSVAMELRNEKASTFLEKKYSSFKKSVEDVFGVYVTCSIYSVKESGSNLYLFMFANDNHNRLLSSSDMIRGLNASKSLVETAASVNILNVALARCGASTCKNGGVCSTVVVLQNEITIMDSPSLVLTSLDANAGTSCFCMPAFTGPFCEQSQKPCGSDYCNHGGTCVNSACQCPSNWQGDFCQNDVDECAHGSDCKNGATCHNTDGSYECICTQGYQGKFCDTPNFCASQPCSPHGTCEELIDSYLCRCEYGYHGPTCELSSMSFGEGSYALFSPVDNYHTFNISMYFATVSSNALLMFSPVTISQVKQGFMAVEIVGGRVRVTFLLDPPNDPLEPTVISLSTSAVVNTGYWYRLEFTKVTWTANLIVQKCPDQTCDSCVDKRKECYNETNFASQNLQIAGQYISIGGIKTFTDIVNQKGLVSTHDFVGCIHSVSINNRPFGSGLDSGASTPTEIRNVSSTCPRKQAGSLCYNVDCHDGVCVDRWSEASCKCSSKYMDDVCSSVRQPFTLGKNTKVKYSLRQSFVRDATLSALKSGNFRRRRSTADSTLILRLRTVEKQGFIMSSTAGTTSCLLWFDEAGLHFWLKSSGAVSDPLSLTDVSINDSSWHNVTVYRSGTTFTLEFDEQKSQSKVFGEAYDFDGLNLEEMVVAGSAVVQSNQEIPGFQGCLSQFLINGESVPLNGSSDKYVISSEGALDGTCQALCDNSPCGGNSKCTPDGEKIKCMYMAVEAAGLETGIIIVIVFFSILLIAIVVVFVLFRTRRDLFHKCVRSKKKSPSLGSNSSHGKVIDNMITAGSINSRYALNPSEEEMIIRNHIAENLTGSKGSSLSARPDLIGSNFSEQPLQLSDGTVIMETGVMNNLLGDEDVPEHYDFENASSIAPSDIAPSEVIRHYRDFRNGTHHHHHHHHHQQLQPSPLNNHLFNKYRDSPVSASTYRGNLSASHIRQSPLSLSGSALSVPHNSSQMLVPSGGRPSSALAALNHSDAARARMSPLTQLNVRSPRTLPQNYNSNNLSRSNSIGSHHSHSSSSSATGHLIPPTHSAHKPLNNKSISLGRGNVPKGLTVEDVNRLNARPDLTDPVSLLEVGSSSLDGRPKVNHVIPHHEPVLDSSLLLEAPDSSSSDSGANDSFTCSEFEYDNDNVRNRLELDPKKMIFSKLTEVENENDDHHHLSPQQKLNPDGFNSNGDSFTSTNPSSSSSGSPSTPNQQYLISNQYDFDALLNWAPNFDKFVGVFRDIAQLPDTGQKSVTDHDYEEYV